MSKSFSTNTIRSQSYSLEDPEFPHVPPSFRCQPIIDYTAIRFHDEKYELPITLFEDSKYKFGLFDLQIRGEIPITKKHLHIFFTIDCTGSMQDICGDGRSKMQHILFTLENMLHILHETAKCEISVHVQSFDTQIYPIIINIDNIKSADIEILVQQIKKIRPRGSTNIEIALRSAANQIAEYKILHPEHDIAHIFLTDGEITDGSKDDQVLKNLVPVNCTNIFIGYGLHHDSFLLSGLASNKNNEYRFVDALEKAGLVYGEVIHSLLYKAIEDVTLETIDCEIYDYFTNTWTTKLEIGNLLSEQKKIYHLRSKTHTSSFIRVWGKTIVQTKQFEEFTNEVEMQTEYSYKPLKIGSSNDESEALGNNLVNFALRQRTQELLFEARKFSEQNKNNDPFHSFLFNNYATLESPTADDKEMKKKLKQFHLLLLDYIKTNNLENDPFLKTLCDDIYIANRTTGTPYATMFTAARQTSQGRQQTYNCSNIDELEIKCFGSNLSCNGQSAFKKNVFRPFMSRATNNLDDDLYNNSNKDQDQDPDQDANINNYTLSHDALSPYSTLGVVSVMRGVSGDDSLGVYNQTLNLDSP